MADPQVNPNALGAPTEGFGQTVTFAFDPRGVTPSLQLANSTPAAIGVSGAGRGDLTNPDAAASRVNAKSDGTTELLMRVGQDILAPKLEAERNAKFISGVQQAMQGAAAKDIAAQQPWYSRIFGDTPAVEGARAYEVSAKVNEVVSQQAANMDKLKTLDAAGAAKHFGNLIDTSLTGDPASDALMAKGLLDQLPGLMKAQAKAYHGHVQLTAAKKMGENMTTGAAALQQAGQMYAEDTIDSADWKLRERAFINSIVPPEGINEETYAKTLAGRLRGMADEGQFHAINAVKRSGAYDLLTPEQQNTLNAAVTAATKRRRDNYSFEYGQELSQLRSDAHILPAGISPADISGRITKANTAFQRLTGSTEPLISADEAASLLTGSLDYMKNEVKRNAERVATLADRSATAEAKQVAQLELEADVDKYIARGDAKLAGYVTKASQDMIHSRFMGRFDAAMSSGKPGDKEKATDLLRVNFNKGYVSPIIADRYQSLLKGVETTEAPSDPFFNAVSEYEKLSQGPGGKALAAAYFGDYAPRLERFINMGGNLPKSAVTHEAFQAAMSRDGTTKPEALSRKEVTGLAGEVLSEVNDKIPRFMGGKFNQRPETIDAIADIAQDQIAAWRGIPGVTDKEAVRLGISAAVTSGKLETIGGFAVKRGETKARQTLRDAANAYGPVPEGREDEFFQSFMESKGVDIGKRVFVYPAGQVGGQDLYQVSVHKDGVLTMIPFSSDEWGRYAGNMAERNTRPADKPFLAFGPALNGVPQNAPGTPSPYADKADWAAFRAEQARKNKSKP